MKAIIFGVNGQDGFYLNNLLIGNAVEVIGVSRSNRNWVVGNVADYNFVESLIKKYKPDFVFHLAANSTTKHNVLFENHETISTGTLNILEGVYRFSRNTKVFISGSGLQFKNFGLPIAETDPFEASSAYCVSRIQSVYTARYYRSLGVNAYVGYFFHHDSPLRSERHLNMRIAKAALRIKDGGNETISIGNVDVIKEYNDAEDVVTAIWTLVMQNEVFETVIGSGVGYSIKQWIQICFDIINKDWEKYICVDKEYVPDFMKLVSNPATLYSLGWEPKYSIRDLAKKMMY